MLALLVVIYSLWFGYIVRLSQWGGRGYFPAQIVSTCLRGGYRRRRGDIAPYCLGL
jgi:hypothetical protein